MGTAMHRLATYDEVDQFPKGLVDRALNAGAALDLEFADEVRLAETASALMRLAKASPNAIVMAASMEADVLAAAVTRCVGRSVPADAGGPVILVDMILATGVQLSATVHRLRQSGVTVRRAVVVAADPEALIRTRTDLAIEVDALRSLA
jgi:predicted phosphoribosyltransferase